MSGHIINIFINQFSFFKPQGQVKLLMMGQIPLKHLNSATNWISEFVIFLKYLLLKI